jgi:hypothetical protein
VTSAPTCSISPLTAVRSKDRTGTGGTDMIGQWDASMQSQQSDANGVGASYEFNSFENDVLRRVGARARTWGVMSVVIGVLLMLLALIALASLPAKVGQPVGIAAGLLALPPILSGTLYASAGAAMRSVVESEGNDVVLVMNAVKSLTRAMRVETWAAMVAFGIGCVLGAVAH